MPKIRVTLPDGAVKEVAKGSTCMAVAEAIGPRLAAAALAAKVDGKLVDMSRQLQGDCRLQLLTFKDAEGKSVFWHSVNHVLAQAVAELYPEVALGIGPAVDEGFYYDFFRPTPFTPDDFAKIEGRMEEIVKLDYKIRRMELTKEEAAKFLAKKKTFNRFRLELLEGFPFPEVSFYEQGPFVDMCEGPHVPNTGCLKAFKLTKVAAAFWRGDSKREQLQRIYGIAYPTKKELDEHSAMIEEAAKRDHRKIASQLDLFSVSDSVGGGLILYHPNGAIIRSQLEEFMRSENLKRGYLPVYQPHIIKSDLWKTSGHYDNYKENMFFTQVDGQEYGLKPMNCPGHITIYNARSHSYRELPLRFFEFGTVYRQELSGVLSGLFRVRGFTQDDGHLFMTPSQIKDEVAGLLEFALSVMKTFGFSEYAITLSTKPAKAMGENAAWEKATSALRASLEDLKLKFDVDEGGGAFYGPKIDIKIKDAIGRMWQCTTIQLDFNLPERFDATYVGQDGQKHRCVMVHRAIFGSFERFLAVLIEHYAGAFPLWLSPVQVALLPVNDGHNGFCSELAAKMRARSIRTEVDDSQEKTGAKIRNAQLRKIPLMLVVGDKEAASGRLAVRTRDGKIEEGIAIGEFIARTAKDIEDRR